MSVVYRENRTLCSRFGNTNCEKTLRKYMYTLHIPLAQNWSFFKSSQHSFKLWSGMIIQNLSHFETRTKRWCTFQINFFWCWLSWKGRIGWFLNPQHLFIFVSKWLKFGRIIGEHNLKLCWDPWHFRFKKRLLV